MEINIPPQQIYANSKEGIIIEGGVMLSEYDTMWFSKSNDPHEHFFELVLWTLRDTLFRETPTFQPYEHVLKLLLLLGQHAFALELCC